MNHRCLLQATLILLLMISVHATTSSMTHHVPGEFGTIQAGLNASSYGDTVLVQPGTYVESIIWPMVDGIKLIAAGDYSNTIIDGNHQYHVIYMASGYVIDIETVIDGFTLKNGYVQGRGGGMYCFQSSPTILNCSFTENESYGAIPNGRGGGLYAEESDLVIDNCIFSWNTPQNAGGGIWFMSCEDPKMSNCTVNNNTVLNGGGGIFCWNSDLKISKCEITMNLVIFGQGGGILCIEGSSAVFERCVVSENIAGDVGGGFFCAFDAQTQFTNCVFDGNTTYSGVGGGISCRQSILSITNSAISNSFGEGVHVNDLGGTPSTLSVGYCDLAGNSGGAFGGPDVDPLYGIIVGTNANGDPCDNYFNIFLDPMYVDPDNGEYHLLEGSPCIDAGDPTSPVDPDDTVADIGAFYFDQNDPEPVEVTLTPTSPTNLPAVGGTLAFDVNIVSNLPGTYPGVMFWTKVKLPNGNYYPQTLFSTTFTLLPYMDYTGSLTQDIPAYAPPGSYEMWGWVGQNPNYGPQLGGFFPFTKSAIVTDGSSVCDWSSTGQFTSNGEEEVATLPVCFDMSPAYPNPFNPSTSFSVTLPETANLTINVYNVTGQLVAAVANGKYNAGQYMLTFDASQLPSGLYFVRASVPGELEQTQKVMLVK